MVTDTQPTIRRRFKVGTVDREGVFVNAQIDGRLSGGFSRLSITADIYRSGHDVGGGQALDTVRAVITRGTIDKGTSYQQIRNLLDIWERWHLNDMRAGCEHQRELGWKSYDEHPSEPCPVCGYKFGTAWLREDLPAFVFAFIEGLPNNA